MRDGYVKVRVRGVQAGSLTRRRGAGVLSATSISFIAALVAAFGERPIRRYLASRSRKCRAVASAEFSPRRRRMRFGVRGRLTFVSSTVTG